MSFPQKIFCVGLLGYIFFSLPSLSVVYFPCNCMRIAAHTLCISAHRWTFLLPVIRWFTSTAAPQFARTFTYVIRFRILATDCYQSNRLTVETHHFFLMKRILAVYLFHLSSSYWVHYPHISVSDTWSLRQLHPGGPCAHAACHLGTLVWCLKLSASSQFYCIETAWNMFSWQLNHEMRGINPEKP